MRDHRNGPAWDNRTLWELQGYQIRVQCGACRHMAWLKPRDLEQRQPARWNWQLIIPRLRCMNCKTRGNAVAHPELVPKS